MKNTPKNDTPHSHTTSFFESFEWGITVATARLRRATVRRHLGVLSARSGAPLDALLKWLVVGPPIARLAAYEWAEGDHLLPPPDVSVDDATPEAARLGTDGTRDSILSAVCHAGPPLHEVVSGVLAASDRSLDLWNDGALAMDEGTDLPVLFDAVASAYATGVAIARAADGEMPTAILAPHERALHRLERYPRDLLLARYGLNFDLARLANVECVPKDMLVAALADALEEVRLIAGLTAAPRESTLAPC